MTFQVVATPLAREMFLEIEDRRVRQQISKRIKELATDPEKRGKPLGDELTGFHALRVSGQRYRVVYGVDFKGKSVTVIGTGIRKQGDKGDIYERLKRLARMGLLPSRR